MKVLPLRINSNASVSRDDLAALLSKMGASLTVKALLDNLQLTAEFESSMVKKWATPVRTPLMLLLVRIFT